MTTAWKRRIYTHSVWLGCLFAATATLMALLLRMALPQELARGAPFALFYISVTVSAFYGGGLPGLLATILGLLAGPDSLTAAEHPLQISGATEILRIVAFLGEGILLSGFGAVLHRVYSERDEQKSLLQTEVFERRKAQDKLSNDARRKDEFLAIMAHELRNPLAPISNAISILNTTDDVAMRKRVIGVIDRQVRQMTHLVEDLMDIERIVRNKIVLRKEPVLLSNAIHRAIECVKPLIDEQRHSLRVCLPSEPVWLNGDLTRLIQIFANVLNNAVKYTETGGEISIDGLVENGKAKIVISDNGIGIEQDMIPKIFDMFTQVDGAGDRCHKGIGIGLALVKKLVGLHGGSVTACSGGPGTGSQFTIYIPTMMAGVPASAAAPERGHLRASGRRGLVVDDNADSAQTLAWMLESSGYDVKVATSGPAAIELAKSFTPDIVLLDIGMPLMDGFMVCAALRRIPALTHAIIIGQSGYGQPEDHRRALEAGFDAYLVKPVSAEAIQDAINDSLDAAGRAPLVVETRAAAYGTPAGKGAFDGMGAG